MPRLSREQAEQRYAREVGVPQMARVTGILYGFGAAFVTASIALPHPSGTNTDGLWIVAVVALIASIAIISLADHFKPWAIHSILLIGSGLISACVALSGTPAGIYSAMYIWVILVAARSFSYFGLGLQLLGILATYGIALSTLETGPGEFANITRWLLSVFALTVTGFISVRLISDARKKEAELIRLSQGAGSLAGPGR